MNAIGFIAENPVLSIILLAVLLSGIADIVAAGRRRRRRVRIVQVVLRSGQDKG